MGGVASKSTTPVLLIVLVLLLLTFNCSRPPDGPDPDWWDNLSLKPDAMVTIKGVVLSWNRLSPAICSGYVVERGNLGDTVYATIDSLGEDFISCLDNDLIANATYCYRVSALDHSGQRALSSDILTVKISGSTVGLSDTICLVVGGGGFTDTVSVTNTANPGTFDWVAVETDEWLSLSSTAGSIPDFFTVTAEANETGVSRSGSVVLTAEDILNSPETLLIVQPIPGGILCPVESEWQAPPLGGTSAEVPVMSCDEIPPVLWTARSRASWLTVEPFRRMSPESITITAGINYSDSCRVGVVTVAAEGLNEPLDTITITQEPLFEAVVKYATFYEPSSICSADIDNDGDYDLAVSCADAALFLILENHGDGTFEVRAPYSTWTTLKSICAADLDSDGDMDFVTIGLDVPIIGIYEKMSGVSWYESRAYFLPGPLTPACAADLDGDADIDLAIANQAEGVVYVVPNNGDATFASGWSYAVGSAPQAICYGDFNKCCQNDLAVANYASDNVSILLNYFWGNFGKAVNYSVASGPSSICCADVNGDNRLDLSVTCRDVAQVLVLKGYGEGTFEVDSTISVVSQPESICAADLDNDGLNELAVAGWGGAILPHEGEDLSTAVLAVGSQTERYVSVCAADFDGDGDPDLALANRSSNCISIFINKSR